MTHAPDPLKWQGYSPDPEPKAVPSSPFQVIEHNGSKLVIGPTDMDFGHTDNSVDGTAVWASVSARTYPDAAETIADLLNKEHARRRES